MEEKIFKFDMTNYPFKSMDFLIVELLKELGYTHISITKEGNKYVSLTEDEKNDLDKMAQDAIAQGAPREAVMQELARIKAEGVK